MLDASSHTIGGLGNVKPSAQNPATKVGEIFDVIGPYLV